jgi:ABC-type transport system involved in multi-copper enzyme maturation permease subunit
VKRGKPFIEILGSALNGDYKFPILEILTFLFLFSSFVFAGFGGFGGFGASDEYFVLFMATSLMGLPLFILVMLLLKNIGSGIGNDLEKGIVQTILVYPLRRRSVLSAKLVSALGTAILLFFGAQISALLILAPDIVVPNLGLVLLAYLAGVGSALLVASLCLLTTLILRRGSLAVVVGIMMFFLFGILGSLTSFLATAMHSPLPIQLYSIVTPITAIEHHFWSLQPDAHTNWAPSYPEALMYVGASYAITVSILVLSYLYFCRRFNL